MHALATAAGCQLVATCDLAVAAESAGFALPGGQGGLFCHTPLVAVGRQIGRKRALEMALTGDVISAATAAEWGLINRVVPDDELDAAVDDLMARATRGSAASKAAGKRVFYAQIDLDQREALRVRVAGDGRRRHDARRAGGHPFLHREAACQLHAAAASWRSRSVTRTRRLRTVRVVTSSSRASCSVDAPSATAPDQLEVVVSDPGGRRPREQIGQQLSRRVGRVVVREFERQSGRSFAGAAPAPA